jgi:hypothetical protein
MLSILHDRSFGAAKQPQENYQFYPLIQRCRERATREIVTNGRTATTGLLFGEERILQLAHP